MASCKNDFLCTLLVSSVVWLLLSKYRTISLLTEGLFSLVFGKQEEKRSNGSAYKQLRYMLNKVHLSLRQMKDLFLFHLLNTWEKRPLPGRNRAISKLCVTCINLIPVKLKMKCRKMHLF